MALQEERIEQWQSQEQQGVGGQIPVGVGADGDERLEQGLEADGFGGGEAEDEGDRDGVEGGLEPESKEIDGAKSCGGADVSGDECEAVDGAVGGYFKKPGKAILARMFGGGLKDAALSEGM